MEREAVFRFGSFLAAAAALALWEAVAPRRPPEPGRTGRWVGNLGVVVLSAALLRLLFPVMPVGLALLARERGWGLLPRFGLPGWAEVGLGLLALDLAIYLQHRAFHAWRPLWRLHRVHHADTFLDFTSGVRFHPLEYVLSLAFKLALVVLLGPPARAVLLFEVLLNCLALFNHANIRIPAAADRILRRVVVTPDMHRVHHSPDMREANRNFGFNFPWWDRMFSTYTAQPAQGHLGMAIGLNIFRGREHRSLWRLLAMPFR